MRKVLRALILALIMVAAVSCTQYVFVPVGGSSGNTVQTTIDDVAANVDTGDVLKAAIEGDDPTAKVIGVEARGGTTGASFMAARATMSYRVTVLLTGYVGTDGGVINGLVYYTLTSIGSDWTYTVELSSVTVKAEGAASAVSATVSGFTGTVTGITVEGDSITAGDAVTVSQDKYDGEYVVGGEAVTEAGVNNEGEGTKANPYVLKSDDDVANINSYGDGAYLSLGYDVTRTVLIKNENVTLDLNGHTITVGDSNVGVCVQYGSSTILDSRNGEGITGGVPLWADYDGTITVENGNYHGKISAGYVGNFAKTEESIRNGHIVINDGTFYGYDGGFAVWGDSSLVINDGDFTSDYNLVVMTNGSKPLADCHFDITVNDGTFNASMIELGRNDNYIAGGFYIANSGTLNLNGGVLNIDGGVGVVMRAGTVNVADGVVINHTNTTGDDGGKAGDAPISLDVPNDIVVDLRSDYPGEDPIVNNNAELNVVYIEAEDAGQGA